MAEFEHSNPAMTTCIPGVSPQRSVDPAGRGVAATSLTVRHGVPMTVVAEADQQA
jgi:hypothetical protein